jgi:hypothetical protein
VRRASRRARDASSFESSIAAALARRATCYPSVSGAKTRNGKAGVSSLLNSDAYVCSMVTGLI